MIIYECLSDSCHQIKVTKKLFTLMTSVSKDVVWVVFRTLNTVRFQHETRLSLGEKCNWFHCDKIETPVRLYLLYQVLLVLCDLWDGKREPRFVSDSGCYCKHYNGETICPYLHQVFYLERGHSAVTWDLGIIRRWPTLLFMYEVIFMCEKCYCCQNNSRRLSVYSNIKAAINS